MTPTTIDGQDATGCTLSLYLDAPSANGSQSAGDTDSCIPGALTGFVALAPEAAPLAPRDVPDGPYLLIVMAADSSPYAQVPGFASAVSP